MKISHNVETKELHLPSDGFSETEALSGAWTLHRYVGSETQLDKKGEPGLAHVYECTVTGARRRYGFDHLDEGN